MTRVNRHYGPFGGRFVPEMLYPALDELQEAYLRFRKDRSKLRELDRLRRHYVGRPTPLYLSENLTRLANGCQIYLKLEGLAHTGAHKINNALGQAFLAKEMGKKRLVAETGAGQHGLATAAAAARFGLDCLIFMGENDMKRQYPNVFHIRRMGAEVVAVRDGSRTLKDAVNASLKYWIEHLKDTHYLLGSALGPSPYPRIVADFQSVIGQEVKGQLKRLVNRPPDILVACVGGGSNSLGLFKPFLRNHQVRLVGVEAGGRGPAPGDHAVRFSIHGRPGIAQGYRSVFLQDPWGQILPTHSISAGLDYAGISPELAFLQHRQRVEFDSVSDREALAAFDLLCRQEGIVPALESSHAIAWGMKHAAAQPQGSIMVIGVSGRGDKDLFITARHLEKARWIDFLKQEAKR